KESRSLATAPIRDAPDQWASQDMWRAACAFVGLPLWTGRAFPSGIRAERGWPDPIVLVLPPPSPPMEQLNAAHFPHQPIDASSFVSALLSTTRASSIPPSPRSFSCSAQPHIPDYPTPFRSFSLCRATRPSPPRLACFARRLLHSRSFSNAARSR